MPAGPETLGLVYFSAVKFAGYSAACYYLKRRYPSSKVHPLLAGATRTGIGLIVGPIAIALISLFGRSPESIMFFMLLIPLRYFEWSLLLRLFYEKPEWGFPKEFKLLTGGVTWSFVLDIPAIIAVFSLPGGAWVC